MLLLALAPVGFPGDHQTAAADRGLVVLMQTRYDPAPDRRLIRVTIDAVATSYTPNSDQGLAYYSSFTFAVPEAADAVSASSDGQPLSTRLGAAKDTFRQIDVAFAHDLFYQQSYAFQVSFELPDKGGAPNRDLRVGTSIVAFPVLAYGSLGEAGSSVQVVLPAGFRASIQGSPMVRSTDSAGRVVLTADNLSDPFGFYAYLAADRPGTFGEHHLQTTIDGQAASLWVRSWEDDPEWGTRVSDLMNRGLPALQGLIGLRYPVTGTLTVEEAAPTILGDYAGTYTQATGSILVRYDADAYVALHEAAHIWFNETLFDERWINEGFAELYGVQAAAQIGAQGEALTLTNDLLKSRIPLNDWGAAGIPDSNTEYFAYAASYQVAGLLLDRVAAAGLRVVWQSLTDGEVSYLPAHASGAPETGVTLHVARWQQLLDLIDERTGTSVDDIWSEWVVDAAQRPLMQDRATARTEYAALARRAGDWNLPRDLRLEMSSWQFAAAEAEIGVATTVLADRGQISALAGALGLTPPRVLKAAFEGGGGIAVARDEAAAELRVLRRIAAAADRLAKEPDPFEAIGLLGSSPDATLASARGAFEADHLDAASAAIADALAVRDGAESAGQLRSGFAGGGLLVLGGGTFLAVRLRRRRQAAEVLAERDAPVPIDPPAPGTASRPG